MWENNLDTPAVCVDLDVAQRNIEKLQSLANRYGIKVRPHTKTSKSVYIAKAQLAAGACGITAAKLGEAEVMAQAGIRDILIAFPLIGRQKLERLKKLMAQADITVSLDHPAIAEGLAEVGVALKRPVPVYIEIDSGLKRVGFEPGEQLVRFAQSLHRMPGIEVAGIMTHGGHSYGARTQEQLRAIATEETRCMLESKAMIEAGGVPVREVSVGATPTVAFMADMAGITEVRPGTYVFNDYNQLLLGTAGEADCAVKVVCTVVSRPAPGRIIIDAGSKTLTSDSNVRGDGFGYVTSLPHARIARLSEEHGVIEIPPESEVGVGDVLTIIPNHVCPVVNLADRLSAFRSGVAAGSIEVDARGKNK